MVERRPPPNLSWSTFHTDQPRSTTQTYFENTTTTWIGQRRAYRLNQTTSGTFPKMETSFATGQATTLLLSSTTPRRRGWWLDTVTSTAKRILRVRLLISVRSLLFTFTNWFPQPFNIMIRIPFERDRLSHGHLVHPVELAHLVHYWDSRKLIERDQRNALEACSSELRKMAPLIEELVNIPRPDHPLQHLAPNITAMLTGLRWEVDSRITATQQAFAPIPTPFAPYMMPVAACGDYMTTTRLHCLDSTFTLAAVALLRRWIGREHPNHGFMFRPETSDRLRQVLILCNPLSALTDNKGILRLYRYVIEMDKRCFADSLVWDAVLCLLLVAEVAGAKLRTPIYRNLQRFPFLKSWKLIH